MARFGFAKEHSDNGGAGFVVTNEDPETHIKLLEKYINQKKPPQKALSICSGGEIPIYVLLPVVKRVFAIDHGATALAAAQVKALWLSQWGPEKLQKFLKGIPGRGYDASNSIKFKKALKAIYPRISAALRDSGRFPIAVSFDPFGYDIGLVKSKWAEFDNERLARARKRLGSLKFILGDIVRDTKKFGPFDVIYTSNCTEHSGRNSFQPALNDFEPLLKPGGLVLYTSGGFIDRESGYHLGGPEIKSGTAQKVNNYSSYPHGDAISYKITHGWEQLEKITTSSWPHAIAQFDGTPFKAEKLDADGKVTKTKAA